MGLRTAKSDHRKKNSRKPVRRRPKPEAGKPDWVELAKRLQRAMTEPVGTTDPMVLRLDADDTIEARERIDHKLGLILANVTVVADMLKARNYKSDSDVAAILDHQVSDALVDQMAEIGLLLGETVEEQEQVAAEEGGDA